MTVAESPRDTLDLDALRKLVDAATRAPWTAHPDGLVWSTLIGDPVSGSAVVADAEFIAAVRNAAPDLFAEMDRLRARLDAAHDALTRIDGGDEDSMATLESTVEYIVGRWQHLADAEAKAAAEVDRLTAELAQARADERNTIAADIENMPINLGDAGWKHLEKKAVEADYPAEWVHRRRTRDDFTTATIEVAYQYGYRQAAKVARKAVAR